MQNDVLLKPDQASVDKYFKRQAEPRKVRLFNKLVPQTVGSVLDFGCGNGLYATELKKKAQHLIGLDVSDELLDHCKSLNAYDDIIIDHCPPIVLADKSINVFFASEVIEHMPELDPIMNEVERITSDTIICTMPNPKYAFYYDDPTHILPYTVASLIRQLKERSKNSEFEYKIVGLGFENIPGGAIARRLNQAIMKFFPVYSPTIAVVGTKKK